MNSKEDHRQTDDPLKMHIFIIPLEVIRRTGGSKYTLIQACRIFSLPWSICPVTERPPATWYYGHVEGVYVCVI